MRILRLLLPVLGLISGALMFGKRRGPAPAETAAGPVAVDDLVAQATAPQPETTALHNLLLELEDENLEAAAVFANHAEALLQPLLDTLRGDDVHLRKDAAAALGLGGQPAALGPLVTALGDYSFWVRAAAAKSLGQLGDTAAVEALTAALADREPSVQQAAAAALERIGGEAATIALAAYHTAPRPAPITTRRRDDFIMGDDEERNAITR